jgi:TonB-linked SusC/RagA family outer membrane protein
MKFKTYRLNGKPFPKLLLTMKFMIAFFLAGLLQANGAGYAQKITFSKANASLKEVFTEIGRQTGYSFIYTDEMLAESRRMDVKLEGAILEDALRQCFADQPLGYTIKNKTVIIKRREKPVPSSVARNNFARPVQADTLLRGKVTDTTGAPLPGVSVMVKGGKGTGTSTGTNGQFSLRAAEGAVLVFSYMGYRTQEVAVSGRAVINIALKEEGTALDEIVVVGYGTQKKGDITGAVATFNAKGLNERPISRVDQALVGQMAGVQVKQTTGVPGKAMSIQVRGSGSISAGNEPLYVIDGFPLSSASPNGSGSFSTGNPLDNMNPNDIESIQVLKDAASAAIYGSRAANGVVLITTKRGKTGTPQINFNTYAGFSQANRKLDLLNAEEWIDRATEMINAAWVASGPGRTAGQSTDERRLLLGLAPTLVNTDLMLDDRWALPGHPGLQYIDWQDKFFRTGLTQNYQLSASGGTDNVKYYVSGNYANQKGIVINTDYLAYSARANVEMKAAKNITLGFNLAPSYSISNDPGTEGQSNFVHRIVSISPVQEELAENVNVGNYGSYKWLSATTQLNSPITRSNNSIGVTKKFRTLASIFGEYQIMEGLAFKTTVNLDNNDNNSKNYLPYTVNETLSARQAQPGLGTTGSYSGFRRQTFLNENTLSYHKTIKGVHDISAVAGASYNSDKLENVNLASVGGFGSSVITTLNAAAGINGGTTETRNVLLSYFGRVQYAFNNKYLLTASMRRDGSSRFGTNTKWGLFPSASAGWRVSQEGFMKNVKFLNDLKLRASWGRSGNYNIGDYSSIPLLGTYNYSANNTQAFGQAPIGIINPDLGWESSETFDVGLDLTVFKNRVTAAFDYYTKNNKDLLLNVPVPSATGFTSYLNNAGKVKNKGWEFELNTRNLTGAFQWTTSLNLSHNTNKVTELAGGQTQIFIPSRYDIPHSILKVGEPMYSIFVVRQTGILTKEDISNKVAVYGTQAEGDPKYFDANKDGVIDANDREIVGHPSPDYTWGITNSFKYKGFDLSVLVQGQNGGSIYSLLGRSLNRTGMVFADNTLGNYRDRWRSAEDPGNGVVGKAYSTFGRIKNTDWLYTSNYFRVRNITLGYDLGRAISHKTVKAMRVYVTAENYFGHDSYTGGYNPEANNTDLSGSSLFPEAGDYGGLPLPKSLILGFNITF